MNESQIQTHGNYEYRMFDNAMQRRRKGTEEWSRIEPPPPAPSELTLSLVLETQSFGEPDHWSLFVASEGGTGKVYQVKGDAEFMQYEHAEGVDILTSECLKTAYTLCNLTEDQAGRVAYYANTETPPSAPDRAAVTENCQGCTVRVLEKLAAQGIIMGEWLARVKDMVEPP
jgi:hypothetical protein